MYGDISAKAAHMLGQPAVCVINTKLFNPLLSLQIFYWLFYHAWEEIYFISVFLDIIFRSSLMSKCSMQISDFFAKLIQRVSPKSYQQALAEVQVSQKFLENFCGDQVFKPLFDFVFVYM